MPSADPVTEYNNNDNAAVDAVEASDSYGIPQGDPFTEEEASAAPTGGFIENNQDHPIVSVMLYGDHNHNKKIARREYYDRLRDPT